MDSVVLIGRGRVGREIAARLAGGDVPDLRLAAVLGRGDPLDAIERADIVVEAARADIVPGLARVVLPRGRTLVVTSAAGLWHPDMPAIAPGRVLAPSGATLALDALKALAQHEIRTAEVILHLPPGQLPDYCGKVREAAVRFPGHANNLVAAALAIGRDDLDVRVLNDPQVRGPMVEIRVETDTAQLRASLEHFASPAHPEVSRNVALSVVAALRSLTSPLIVGS